MYLHLGQDVVIQMKGIIGVFGLENSTVSKYTREYLAKAEKKGGVINVSMEMLKPFTLCYDRAEQTTVYVSQISSAALLKRSRFMEDLSDV